jgi:two-component system response regulator AtoC
LDRSLAFIPENDRDLPPLVGEAPAFRAALAQVSQLAALHRPVLVVGERGTGKELVAARLTYLSPRWDQPFVKLNCAALAEGLLDSELFGHEAGAFTGAARRRLSRFEIADGGTLFLDEIGEVPLAAQSKLLRLVKDRDFERLGGTRTLRADVRIVAATHRNLEEMIDKGEFREDLFYRINVVRIHVPPLRARGSDILLLAQHFLQRYQGTTPRVVGIKSAAADKLLSYPWPGNVRELQNCIERAVALAQFDHVGVDDLPDRVREFKSSRITIESNDPSELLPMEEVERRYIVKVLEAVGGNKTLAAQVLGFDRRTLYRKLERCRDNAPLKRETHVVHSSHPHT